MNVHTNLWSKSKKFFLTYYALLGLWVSIGIFFEWYFAYLERALFDDVLLYFPSDVASMAVIWGMSIVAISLHVKQRERGMLWLPIYFSLLRLPVRALITLALGLDTLNSIAFLALSTIFALVELFWLGNSARNLRTSCQEGLHFKHKRLFFWTLSVGLLAILLTSGGFIWYFMAILLGGLFGW